MKTFSDLHTCCAIIMQQFFQVLPGKYVIDDCQKRTKGSDLGSVRAEIAGKMRKYRNKRVYLQNK